MIFRGDEKGYVVLILYSDTDIEIEWEYPTDNYDLEPFSYTWIKTRTLVPGYYDYKEAI